MVPPEVQDLADWLQIPEDLQMGPALAAAIAWTRKPRRSTTPEDDLWDDDVRLGTIIYAALLWQRRAAPQGFDGYDDAATVQGYTIYDAYTLVGLDPVVA